jgi:hypothetical protein
VGHFKLWHVPLRVFTGAFILNSGLSKRNADLEDAKRLHQFASGAYPQLADVPADQFVKVLSSIEIALGTALLSPFVKPAVAGAALTAFSGGLLGLYWRTPTLHEEDDPRPTPQGIPIAKDSWMFAIGLALMTDALPFGR